MVHLDEKLERRLSHRKGGGEFFFEGYSLDVMDIKRGATIFVAPLWLRSESS